MPTANLKPNERYAFVGKTRSGKTYQALVLAGTFARTLPAPWEVWWLDTKGSEADIKRLRQWGFRNAASPKDRSPESGGLPNAIYFKIESEDKPDDGGKTDDIVEQSQAIMAEAYRRRHVIVCVDEYTEVTVSDRTAGKALRNIFSRGGGRNVGLIGLTQEPVFVPRQLISQATHISLFSLTYEADIKYVRNLCPTYVPPVRKGDPYGFYWAWIDGGNGEWDYYPNQVAWYDQLQIAPNANA
jgi:hypothetical protein